MLTQNQIEVVAEVAPRPSFGGNPDPAPKVPYSGPRSGRNGNKKASPVKVVMRWGKVTRSYREPVVLTEAERAEKLSYRLSQGGW